MPYTAQLRLAADNAKFPEPHATSIILWEALTRVDSINVSPGYAVFHPMIEKSPVAQISLCLLLM